MHKKREIICGIYKVVSPLGRIYIGKSINCLQRFSRYKYSYCKRQPRLHNSFLKYGVENHTFEIIETCELELLNQKEKYWIKYFNTFDTDHGLNLTEGGNDGCVSKETKDKVRKAHIGFKHTEKTCRKISELLKGNSYAKGNKISDELMEKLKKAAKRPKSDQTKQKMSEAAKGIPKSKESSAKSGLSKRKRVLNTETGIYYNGAIEAYPQTKYIYSYFLKMLCGMRPNKTKFIYA